jgi:N-acetylglucosamine-6-phosphate deacetylase
MRYLLRSARVITPDEELAPGWVLIRDGKIEGVGWGEAPEGIPDIDLGALTLIPGFVDIHVHGGGGFSLLTDDLEQVRSYSAWLPSTGVTSFVPTICAGSIDQASSILMLMSNAPYAHTPGAKILGTSLEGPFVSPDRLGALPVHWACTPDADLLDRLYHAGDTVVRIMTIAPELPGAKEIIRSLPAWSIVPSIGHSDATYQQALAGFEAGASHVTHALNAMRPFHHREPGIVGAALDTPGVTIEVVADGVHLHNATVGLLIRAFGSERVALVTDAVTPAGLESGVFEIDGQEAYLAHGRVTFPDGTIAGSGATMAQAVRNVVAWGHATLEEAVRMASTTPAKVIGWDGRHGRIAPGYDADLVALGEDLSVAATWVRGRLVHGSASPGGTA